MLKAEKSVDFVRRPHSVLHIMPAN